MTKSKTPPQLEKKVAQALLGALVLSTPVIGVWTCSLITAHPSPEAKPTATQVAERDEPPVQEPKQEIKPETTPPPARFVNEGERLYVGKDGDRWFVTAVTIEHPALVPGREITLRTDLAEKVT